MTSPPELHPNVEVMASLVGRWEGSGKGFYPTIEGFEYRETAEWSHVGKPFLAYRQGTVSPAGAPMHSECGYWRSPQPNVLEVVISQPFGAVEMSDGRVTEDEGEGAIVIDMATTFVESTPSAKQVSKVTRRFELSGDTLTYRVEMSAVGEPLQGHLEATLHRC